LVGEANLDLQATLPNAFQSTLRDDSRATLRDDDNALAPPYRSARGDGIEHGHDKVEAGLQVSLHGHLSLARRALAGYQFSSLSGKMRALRKFGWQGNRHGRKILCQSSATLSNQPKRLSRA
jgi:hypothetical protein